MGWGLTEGRTPWGVTVLAGTAAGVVTATGFPPVDVALLGLAGAVAGLWAFRCARGTVPALLTGCGFGLGLGT